MFKIKRILYEGKLYYRIERTDKMNNLVFLTEREMREIQNDINLILSHPLEIRETWHFKLHHCEPHFIESEYMVTRYGDETSFFLRFCELIIFYHTIRLLTKYSVNTPLELRSGWGDGKEE